MVEVSDAKIMEVDFPRLPGLLDIIAVWIKAKGCQVIAVHIAENADRNLWYATITYK